jgi:hypothetical protein
LESKWLTLLDFDPAVVAFATQSLEFDGVDGRGSWCHVPDVFARRADGSGWLLDVKNPQHLGWAEGPVAGGADRAGLPAAGLGLPDGG